jgi:hypothetical protein
MYVPGKASSQMSTATSGADPSTGPHVAAVMRLRAQRSYAQAYIRFALFVDRMRDTRPWREALPACLNPLRLRSIRFVSRFIFDALRATQQVRRSDDVAAMERS